MVKKSTDDVKMLASYPAGGPHVRYEISLVISTDRGVGVAETSADQAITRVYNRRRLVPAGSAAVCRETKEPRREPEEAG